MTHQQLRLITANTYNGGAMRDPESMEALLPHDDIPTAVAFQETTSKHNPGDVIRDHGYQAVLLGSHGLAFAISPDLPVYDVREITYPSRRTGRRWGLHVVKFAVYGRNVTFGAGQGPVFCSRGWPSIPYRDAETFSTYVDEDPDALVIGAGDRNFMTVEQKQAYHREQQAWGAHSLLPETEPTYRLSEGKHRWLSWLGMEDPQLDGISARPPQDMELVRTDDPQKLTDKQIGYRTSTKVITSDHKAVQAELYIPPSAEPKQSVREAIDLSTPDAKAQPSIGHRIQRSCYTLLHLDYWLWDHGVSEEVSPFQRRLHRLALTSARFWCSTARSRALGPGKAFPDSTDQVPEKTDTPL